MPSTTSRPARASAASRGPAETESDRASFRLAVFGAVLVVVLSTGFGIGRLTAQSPASTPAGPAQASAPAAPQAADGHNHSAAGAPTSLLSDATGLAVSAAGYTLVPESTTLAAGQSRPWRFKINDREGRPVTAFATVHTKQMHLVVVRRDLSGYQHLHPTMAPDGTWSVDLRLPGAGSWRAFADFAVANTDATLTAVVLGVDLSVAGAFTPVKVPEPGPQSLVAGYKVEYAGSPRVGGTEPMLFQVTRNGSPVGLEPHLGAFGHLVVVREGDLGYVHVHPQAGSPVNAVVKFWLAAPSPGRYRMFLDFRVAGRVHTAAFTLPVA